jgi:hypothetical protein
MRSTTAISRSCASCHTEIENDASSLGEKLDLKEFHDGVLGSGALPLDVLEWNVMEWIEQQKSATK